MVSVWILAVVALAILVVLLPRAGLRAYWQRRGAALRREQVEDALKHLLQQSDRGRGASLQSLAGALRLSDTALIQLVEKMETQGLVRTQGRDFFLTPQGERVALQVLRAHRLWERYLADEARLPLSQLHREAERREHQLTPDEVDRLDASLGYPAVDPHGDPIPRRDGYLPPTTGTALPAWPRGTPGRVVHLEDEPPLAYAQIVAEGLHVGQIIRVLEVSTQRLLLTDGENEYRLAPAVAANVFLEGVAASPALDEDAIPLSELPPGEQAEVIRLTDACQGFSRRRLFDLGFTAGARLQPELNTFAGDPRAYRVRGTLVALRRDQAAQILVRRLGTPYNEDVGHVS